MHLLPAPWWPANPTNNVYVSGMSGRRKDKGWQEFATKVDNIDLTINVQQRRHFTMCYYTLYNIGYSNSCMHICNLSYILTHASVQCLYNYGPVHATMYIYYLLLLCFSVHE